MMRGVKYFLSFGVTALIGVTGLIADDDIDLRINGDFRGAALGAATAPGWVADTLAGSTKIVQGSDWDEFAMEITAPLANAKMVCTDFIQVVGKTLKLETTIQGNGSASIGFQAFDAAKQLLPAGGQMQAYQAATQGVETKNYFPITDPNIKFIRIFLMANPGSQVVISDIEAEFKLADYVPPAPVQPVVVQPVAVQPIAAPVQPVATLLPLIHDKYYSFSSITGMEEYQVSLPVGSEIDFELGEDAAKNQYWTVSQYDANICRVKMEHDQDGIWPFRYDQAEIELKAVWAGTTRVVFQCAGKNFTVLFTAL